MLITIYIIYGRKKRVIYIINLKKNLLHILTGSTFKSQGIIHFKREASLKLL